MLSIRKKGCFETDKFELPYKELSGHTNNVNSVLELHNGVIATASYDKTIKLWNPGTGTCYKTLSGHVGFVLSLVELSDGTLVSSSNDQTIKLWNTMTGQCIKTISLEYRSFYLAVLPDDRLVIENAWKYKVQILNPKTGGIERTIDTTSLPYGGRVFSLVVLSDGNIACAGDLRDSKGLHIKIWNPNTGNCVKTLAGYTDQDAEAIWKLIALKNNRLASISSKRGNTYTTKVWDLSTGQCIKTLPHEEGHIIAQLSNDTLVIAKEGLIELWDDKLQSIINSFNIHSTIHEIKKCFPDGRIIFASSYPNGTLTLRDIRQMIESKNYHLELAKHAKENQEQKQHYSAMKEKTEREEKAMLERIQLVETQLKDSITTQLKIQEEQNRKNQELIQALTDHNSQLQQKLAQSEEKMATLEEKIKQDKTAYQQTIDELRIEFDQHYTDLLDMLKSTALTAGQQGKENEFEEDKLSISELYQKAQRVNLSTEKTQIDQLQRAVEKLIDDFRQKRLTEGEITEMSKLLKYKRENLLEANIANEHFKTECYEVKRTMIKNYFNNNLSTVDEFVKDCDAKVKQIIKELKPNLSSQEVEAFLREIKLGKRNDKVFDQFRTRIKDRIKQGIDNIKLSSEQEEQVVESLLLNAATAEMQELIDQSIIKLWVELAQGMKQYNNPLYTELSQVKAQLAELQRTVKSTANAVKTSHENNQRPVSPRIFN